MSTIKIKPTLRCSYSFSCSSTYCRFFNVAERKDCRGAEAIDSIMDGFGVLTTLARCSTCTAVVATCFLATAGALCVGTTTFLAYVTGERRCGYKLWKHNKTHLSFFLCDQPIFLLSFDLSFNIAVARINVKIRIYNVFFLDYYRIAGKCACFIF